MSKAIQKGDYEVGDKVRIIWDAEDIYGKIGMVVSIKYGSVGIEFEGGETHFFGFRSSVELVEKAKERVVFT